MSADGTNKIAYSASHTSYYFLTPAARTKFNEVAASILAKDSSSPIELVGGNDRPGVYGPTQSGYVFWISGKEGKAAADIKSAWPAFAAAMNKALHGLDLPTELSGVVSGLNQMGGRRTCRRKISRRRHRRTTRR